MKDIKAKILSNREITPGYFKMLLDAPYIARHAGPGQFVQVRCSDSLDPLWRRPFSIHRPTAHGPRLTGIEILYEIVGKGTEVLSRSKSGGFIDILGPLGKGFILPRALSLQPQAILIAGGIGIAPLVFLAERLAKRKIKTTVLIGAKTKKALLCEGDFKGMGADVHVATDDGSKGYKGFVSKLFDKVLRTTNDERRMTIYVCGPNAMLKSIADICKKRELYCQVSLEEKMACGIGVCLGCAIEVKGERKGRDVRYKLACKDGPVFDAKDIIL